MALGAGLLEAAAPSTIGRSPPWPAPKEPPGGVAGWHTRPGDEISDITDGEARLPIAGQPPRKVAVGEGSVVPAGAVHNARNDGAAAVLLLGVDVVEKGQPLASPASAPAP